MKKHMLALLTLLLVPLCSCTTKSEGGVDAEEFTNLQAINYSNMGIMGENCDGEVYYASLNSDEGGLVKISQGTEEQVLLGDIGSIYMYQDELYYTAYDQKGLYCLKDGNISSITSFDVRSMARSGRYLYIIADDDENEKYVLQMKSVDESSFTEIQDIPNDIKLKQVFPASGGAYVAGNDRNNNGVIYFLEETRKTEVVATIPEPIRKIFFTYDILYAVTDNNIYQVLDDGSYTSISNEFSGVYTAVTAYDGKIIYTTIGEKVGVVQHDIESGKEKLLSRTPYLQIYVIGGELVGVSLNIEEGVLAEKFK